MDATPSYVWDNEFWETFHPGHKEPPVTNADTIASINPKTKFIFSLRDPISRQVKQNNELTTEAESKIFSSKKTQFYSRQMFLLSLFFRGWTNYHVLLVGQLEY